MDKWITVNGNHILIKDGQTVEEALRERFDNEDEEINLAIEDLDKEIEAGYGYLSAKNKKILKSINPNFDPDNENGYDTNCQKCVLAYIMSKITGKEYHPSKYMPDNEFKVHKLFTQNWKALQSKINKVQLNDFLRDYPNETFCITVTWPTTHINENGKEAHDGHIFIAEVDNKGWTRYIDPQTGNDNYTKFFETMDKKTKDAHLYISRVKTAKIPPDEEFLKGGNYFE